MYTEYIYSDRQYEIIEKNIKAFLFDIITKEQKKMADLSSRLISTESPELQEKIKDIYMENDKCISSLLSLSTDLSDVIKKLDMVARKSSLIDNGDVAQLIANVEFSNNSGNNVDTEKQIKTDDVEENENSINQENENSANQENENSIIESNVVSIPVVTEEKKDESTIDDISSENNSVDTVGDNIPVIGNIITPPSVDSENNPINEDSSEPEVVSSSLVVNNDVSDNSEPQIISNVEDKIDNPEEQLMFKKTDANPAKAILTTGKQISKLRESRDSQSSLLTAEGFFNMKDKISETPTNEVIQVEAAGVLDQNTQTTQQQIEQLMTQANDLYQAGNVVESQKLYDQISQLNQSLKQNTVIN